MFPQKRRLAAVKWRRLCESSEIVSASMAEQLKNLPGSPTSFYFTIQEPNPEIPGDPQRVIQGNR
jgi:hypothetical protein